MSLTRLTRSKSRKRVSDEKVTEEPEAVADEKVTEEPEATADVSHETDNAVKTKKKTKKQEE